LRHLEHGGGVAHIANDRQPAEARGSLAQNFEPLATSIGKLGRQAGEISSAMVAAIGRATRSTKAATWVTCVELGPFATFPLSPGSVVQGQEPVWVRTGKPRTELRTQ